MRNRNRQHQQKQGNRQNRGGEQRQNWYEPPATAKQAHHEAAAQARTEYLPVERTIKGNIRASNQRVRDDNAWWNEYLRQVSGLREQTAGAYANAAAQTQGLIGQASGIDTANTQRLNSEEAASAALRGQTPSGAAGQRAAAAQAQRNYLSADLGGAMAARGANQYAYLTDQQRIGTGQKIKSMMDERKRGLSAKQDLLAARKERGGATVKYLNEARNTYLDNALKEKAFHLQVGEANADRAKERREAAEAREANRRANEAQRNENQEQHNQNEAAHNEGKGGPTPSEQHAAKEGRQNAMAAARGYVKAHGWPKSAKEWAGLQILIEEKPEISPKEAAQAVKRLKKRHASQQPKQTGPWYGEHPFQ